MTKRVLLVFLTSFVAALLLMPTHSVSAACPPSPTDKGQASMTLTVAKTGSYWFWARLYTLAQPQDSLFLNIDDKYCGIVVGDSNKMPANAFTWVNYQDGNNAKPILLDLSAGTHTVILSGREDGVGVDRLLFLADASCLPTDTGDNCATDLVTIAGQDKQNPLTPAAKMTPQGWWEKFTDYMDRTKWAWLGSVALLGVGTAAIVMSLRRDPEWIRRLLDRVKRRQLTFSPAPHVVSPTGHEHDKGSWHA
jgi:hypothetical protein